MYYYGARYYDPLIGRFISPDIYVQNFTNPQSLNRYSYVVNNPLRYTDPSGWWTFGIGLNINIGFLSMNVSLSGGFVFDSHGGRALQGRVGTGSSISAGDVGANVQFQITGKDYVEQLQENSRETGASTDLPGNIVIARAGIRGGIDTVSSGQDLGMNINVGVGAGLGPAEGHTNTGETHVQVIHSALPLDPKSPVFITTPKPAQPVNITSNEPRQFMFVLPPPPGAWITTPQTPVMTGPNAPIIVQLSQNYIDPQTGGPNYAAY